MFRRIVALIVCVAFVSTNLHYSYAQAFNINRLPAPGKMVEPAADFVPLTLKGLVLHPEDALKFDFLMDTGNTGLKDSSLKEEALKVMTYFLTALTMKEDDMWVNLSPYEEGKVIENTFGNTVMGRDLLAEDYILKQLTASLVYPEKELGQTFWKEVYSKIDPAKLDNMSIDSINKVWIVPSEAVVWEHDGKVMIIKSHLRVMLDEDFKALKANVQNISVDSKHSQASQIVREVVLPVLEKQVNESEHFTQLRQMYQAMILATWYKKALKESIIAKVYADKGKIKGVDNPNAQDIDAIYQQYLEAFKKGAFNYIKEDVDAATGEIIPRKYFSGGFTLKMGIVSLATALSIWSGAPTPSQAAEIAQSAQPVGTTVLVQGSAAEADGKGQPILLAQTESNLDGAIGIADQKPVNNNEILFLLEQVRWDGNVSLEKLINLGNKAIPGLLEGLKSEKWDIRRSAAKVLMRVADKSAVSGLVKVLTDSEFETRESAEKALKRIGQPGVSILLEAYKNETNNYTRTSIIRILGWIGDKSAIPLIIEALDSGDQIRQFEAIRALNKIGSSNAVPELVKLLNDSSDMVRFAAKETLVGLGKPNVRELIRVLGKDDFWYQNSVEEILIKIGRVAVPELHVAFREGDVNKRRAIARILEQLADTSSVQDLIDALKIGDTVTSSNAVRGLVKIGKPALPNLVTVLRNGSDSQKKYAAEILGVIGDRTTVPELLQLINHENDFVRRSVVEALGQIGDKTAIPNLLNALKDKDYLVAKISIQAIENIARKEGLSVWFEALRSGNDHLRHSATEALVGIGQPAVTGLIEILKSNESRERRNAALALGRIGDKRAINALHYVLSDESSEVSNAARHAMEILGANWWQRRNNSQQWLLILAASGIGALGWLGFIGYLNSASHKRNVINKFIKERKIVEIKGFLDDYDFDVREDARKGLNLLLTDPNSNYQFGVGFLNNEYIDNQIWAISLLAKSRNSKARDHLVKFIERDLQADSDYQLYNFASDALDILRDARSVYRYEYHEEEGHDEYSYDNYGTQYGKVWVVDKAAYWEKVRRSDGSKAESPTNLPTQERWLPVNVVLSEEIKQKVKEAFNSGSIAPESIADSRLRRFMEFLKSNQLEEIVIVGGAVRDAISGAEVKDFDFSVQLPLSAEEKGDLRPLSRETYQKSEAILARLAKALGVTVQQIKDDSNPVKFEGVPIQYLGPGITNGMPGTVINNLIVDQTTGDVQVGFTGAEILFMGMDASGQLFGHQRALKNWLNGKIVLKGDLREGRNMGPLMVLKMLRLRHQFGLAISDIGEKFMRKAFEESRSAPVEPQLLASEISSVIENAIDQAKAKQELKDWGFELPDAQAFSTTNRLVGIGAMAAILALGSAVPTDVQAAGFSDAINNLFPGLGLQLSLLGGSILAILGVAGGLIYLKSDAFKKRKKELSDKDVQQRPDQLGGIALDSRMMDLQIKRDGNGVPLPVSEQPWDQINLQGFVPQILDIKTINLNEFLGLNAQDETALAKI